MNIKHTIVVILRCLRLQRKLRKKLSPDKLSHETMAEVMREVNFLRGEHAVDVRNLKPGEIPHLPKRADK